VGVRLGAAINAIFVKQYKLNDYILSGSKLGLIKEGSVMDAMDILTMMKNHPPQEPVSLTTIPLLLAQAIAAIAGHLSVSELDKLIDAGAALCAHEHDVQNCSVEADLLLKQLSEPL